MAQEQQNIHVASPGFAGLNTQDSPVEMDIRFASIANNCVIDDQGRISSRKGFQQYTEELEVAQGGGAAVGLTAIEKAFEYVDVTGVSWMFLCGGGKIWLQHQNKDGFPDTKAVELTFPDYTYTPGGVPPSATDNDWDFASMVDFGYFVQAGFHPLVFDPAFPTVLRLMNLNDGIAPFTGVTGTGVMGNPYVSVLGYPDNIAAAFGHIWLAGWDENKSIVQVSDLVTYGDTGEQPWILDLDLTQVWPNGADTIVAMKAHNNFMIFFGTRSIVVYAIPDVPAYALAPVGPTGMTLVDTVDNMGCIARDTIHTTGKDILFLDHTGVRSFGRTIQEKSMPLGDVSYNVKSELQTAINGTISLKRVFAVFNPEESLYTLTFPELNQTYCLDTDVILENGSMKITKWTASRLRCGVRAASHSNQAGYAYYGGVGGLYKYTGGEDLSTVSGSTALIGGNGADAHIAISVFTIPFSYWTQQQSFGIMDKLKIMKQVTAAIIGSGGVRLFFKWVFEYSGNVNTTFVDLDASESALFGDPNAEYNDALTGPVASSDFAYYGGSTTAVLEKRMKIWGNGRLVKFGFEAAVKTNQIAIQELNIQALIGRTA